MRRVALVITVASFLMVACSSSSTAPPPVPARMFVGADAGLTASIFTLPISNTSVASGTLTSTGSFDGMCTDRTGRLFVPDDANNDIAVYSPPVRNAVTPAFTLPIANRGDCAFDANGNLYLLTVTGIGVIPGPVGSSSTVTSTVSNADIALADRVAVDASGNLFVGNEFGAAANVVEFSPLGAGNAELAKFGTGANAVEGLAIGPDNNLYVSNATANGKIDVYKPPFSNSSVVDHTITVTTTQLDRPGFGPDGNLYVSARADNVVDVFAAPYTGAAIAATPMSAPTGIAFGP